MYFSFKFSMYFARICTRFIERQAGIDRNNDILIETKLESEMANCENWLVSEGKQLQECRIVDVKFQRNGAFDV